MQREVVIVDAVRTPIGRFQGSLSSVRPDDLAASVIRALLERQAEFDPVHVEDVIFGCANQAGEDNRNIARMALLLAGLPDKVGGCTVNRLCGSGLEAVNQATAAIAVGCGEVMIAGGVESMSRAPLVMLKPEDMFARGNQTLVDSTLGWRFVNPRLAKMYDPISMGETAENVAEKFGISREEQDQFAITSLQRSKAAWEQGKFADEVIPVPVTKRDGDTFLFAQDEHPRPQTTLEKLSQLLPAFREGGSVTAGNSSGINDGASAVLLMEKEFACKQGATPLARIAGFAVAGVHPHYMGMGPVEATRKVLQRTGLTVKDLDLVELNEAFAAQALACMRELGFDAGKVNVNGGAIALGHPLGASGARIMTTLVHELKRRGGRYGLATMCIGVGQGIATLIERVDG
ncbi:thiolase family protein [Paenactinomyces guangxiensis]|uniref:acetyl-CoA C-acyltransferase n=1 Tax=Paenactinomyces guangxiensis TaxID=1490290 RepID=A0A7W1WP41_9BACL|nr:acetyl-CoA C-acyltransferase [Paenactinomyces guangxiensis]MBA4493410.1 acetyl-CoA C-acyltransferase [Paenactinomyces guangxiensis]MBH8590501.1 acetyl-CoA C-acyltransferase [Paenactinomyces guangxiensis]